MSGHFATAIDNGLHGREWLEQIVVVGSVTAVGAIALAGLTFWLVLVRLDEPTTQVGGEAKASNLII